MSKGPGRVMREALELLHLNPGPIDSYTLAALVYGVKPQTDGVTYLVSPAQVSSVRRAMAMLVRAGKAADIGRSACAPTSRRSYATPERAAEIWRDTRRRFGGRAAMPTDPIRPRPGGRDPQKLRI